MITSDEIGEKCRHARKIGLVGNNYIYIKDHVYCFANMEVKHASECSECPCFKKGGEE